MPSGIKGGAEQLLLQIAKEQCEKGNKVTIFFLTNVSVETVKKDAAFRNIQFRICPVKSEMLGLLILPFLCLSFSFLNKKNDRVITSHVHLNAFAGIMRKIGFIRARRHIARETTLIFKRFTGKRLLMFRLFYKVGYRFIDVLICQTELMKCELIRNLPYLEKQTNIIVLQNPLNLREAREKAMLPSNLPRDRYIVAAGSLTHTKGFDVLIRAYKKISNLWPDLSLLILGKGPEENPLRNVISQEGLTGKVVLKGWNENVYPYFANAKACVVSSRVEGFPNVLLQMMSCSETVISTLCAGSINEIQGLYTCEPDNVDALYIEIKEALQTDNTINRSLFDAFLHSNSIQNYVEKINVI